jgi:hypothetical protein
MEQSQKNSGQGILALVFIGLGLMALMGMDMLWPMFILLPGLAFLAAAYYWKPGAAPLAIPGMLVTGTGAMMFIMNLTNYWQSWAYAWTLYGVFLGMGFVMMGRLMDETSIQRVGHGFMTAGMVAFVICAIFFELFIGLGGGLGGVEWAVILIGLGLFLLAWNRAGRGCVILARFDADKTKRKPKREEKLFTGPIVYGSRISHPARSSRLSEAEEPVAHPRE